jgi:hypothetical protein
MFNRFATAAVAASFALTACGSTGAGETSAQAPVQPMGSSSDVEMEFGDHSASTSVAEPWAPAPWTGSFQDSAVMLANTFRIEGPVGLLEHVVASSDDAFYERSMETTPEGLLQIVRRVSPDVPEIRVQLDAWTLAAFDRVTILERVDCVPVTVIASGDALWRNADGRIAKGQRIECSGEIGDDTPSVPLGAVDSVPSLQAEPEVEPVVETEVDPEVETEVEPEVVAPVDVPEGVDATQGQ